MGAQVKTTPSPASGLGQQWIDFLSSGLGGSFNGMGGGGNGFTQDQQNTLAGFGLGTPTKKGQTPSTAFAGANPIGATKGIAGDINDILSSGAGQLGGSLQQLLARQNTQNIGDLRARFGQTGNTYGTGAQFAESNYRAAAAPEAATQIGRLQLETLMPLLQLMSGTAGKGIPQSQNYLEQNPLVSGLEALSGVAGGTGSFLKGLSSMGGGGGGTPPDYYGGVI